ncbi:hypothetical protein J6590_051161 [Homalodisca vitripennis]|nr:hypothetical protein J6590_051161 [Homalodisca vitripennis]
MDETLCPPFVQLSIVNYSPCHQLRFRNIDILPVPLWFSMDLYNNQYFGATHNNCFPGKTRTASAAGSMGPRKTTSSTGPKNYQFHGMKSHIRQPVYWGTQTASLM